MDEKDVKQWMSENIVRSADAHMFTKQSRNSFKQSFKRGLIKPYLTLNLNKSKIPTHLFLKSDLLEYKNTKK